MQTINLKRPKTINFTELFNRLIHHRDSQVNCSHSAGLGPWLHHQLSTGILPKYPHLPFESGTYTRTYVSKESLDENPHETIDSPFEALVMRWDGRSKTSIHGHPKFSFYHVMSGVFEIELFEQSATGNLQPTETQQLVPNDSTWFSGESCCYDNCIHRVNCLEPGLTFHVYSDDALKGAVFE